MANTETIDTVRERERERERELYSSKLRNSFNSEQKQKNDIRAKQGGNTFSCNMRQTRLKQSI